MIAIQSEDFSQTEASYDKVLIKRFVDGDESAFNEIVFRYRDKMIAVALGMLRNSADAEEIAQDVFIRAYRNLKNFRGDSSLSTWLHRINLNLSRNRYWYYFRRKKQQSMSLDACIGDDMEMTIGSCVASSAQPASQEMIINEFEAMVAACMRELSWKHREILEMRIFDHRSYEYISEALCVDVGTVKSRIARARTSLLSLMASNYPDLAGDNIAKMLCGDRMGGLITPA